MSEGTKKFLTAVAATAIGVSIGVLVGTSLYNHMVMPMLRGALKSSTPPANPG